MNNSIRKNNLNSFNINEKLNKAKKLKPNLNIKKIDYKFIRKETNIKNNVKSISAYNKLNKINDSNKNFNKKNLNKSFKLNYIEAVGLIHNSIQNLDI